jgi:hypothetical protein
MSTPLSIPPAVAAYMKLVQAKHPEIRLLPKGDSFLMKVVGLILRPFNPSFNSRFTTTIGSTIWMPSEVANSLSEDQFLEVMAHEVQHILDHKEKTILFEVGYLFPQILALLSLFAFCGFWSTAWLLCLLFLVFLAPLPAYWRYKAELNGYRVSILFDKLFGRPPEETYEWVAKQMTGPNYYFAWPFKGKILSDLKDESFLEAPRYKEISEFLNSWYKK